jgi:hypothetical protein
MRIDRYELGAFGTRDADIGGVIIDRGGSVSYRPANAATGDRGGISVKWPDGSRPFKLTAAQLASIPKSGSPSTPTRTAKVRSAAPVAMQKSGTPRLRACRVDSKALQQRLEPSVYSSGGLTATGRVRLAQVLGLTSAQIDGLAGLSKSALNLACDRIYAGWATGSISDTDCTETIALLFAANSQKGALTIANETVDHLFHLNGARLRALDAFRHSLVA